MTRQPWRRRAATVTALLALALPTGAAGAGPALAEPPVAARVQYESCAEPPAATPGVRCLSVWSPMPDGVAPRATAVGAAVAAPTTGYGPADIRSAYTLPSSGGSSMTIAIVDAADNPNVESDLAAYRSAWGLPACTTANGCFRKVDQRGGMTFPPGDKGWGVEIALDVQAVSAACSSCRILLVEADDIGYENMGQAVDTAVRLGGDVVSNSYGADEWTGLEQFAAHYRHPGVPILASSGDLGFHAASYPAVLSSTWAVGGTRLTSTAAGGFAEEAWQLAGSSCSAVVPKPTFQKDANCAMRTVADISATADSDEGFAVYDTFGLGDDGGWITVGGTSLAAPLIAGMIGLAGNPEQVADPAWLYAHRSGLHDVVGGVTGFCGGDYLCTGVTGYDAPTGLGSPRGLSSL